MTAAQVYDAASRLLNADFAGLNFPDVPSAPAHVDRLLLVLHRRPDRIAELERAGRWHPDALAHFGVEI